MFVEKFWKIRYRKQLERARKTNDPVESRYVSIRTKLRNKPSFESSIELGYVFTGERLEGTRVGDFFRINHQGYFLYLYYHNTLKVSDIAPEPIQELGYENIISYVPKAIIVNSVKDKIVLSWQEYKDLDHLIYEKREGEKDFRLIEKSSSNKLVKKVIRGQRYKYLVQAVSKDGKVRSKKSRVYSIYVPKKGVTSVKNFLKVAIAPIGNTLYVAGGGYGLEGRNKRGFSSKIGISPQWRYFYERTVKNIDLSKSKYRIHSGLDCSGYVGFAIYNSLEVWDFSNSYQAYTNILLTHLYKKGLGDYIPKSRVKDYKVGDIMSTFNGDYGHTWIVLGTCDDGSIVVVHSSQSGVKLSGSLRPDLKKPSQAHELAKKYMKKYYPIWTRYAKSLYMEYDFVKESGILRWHDYIMSDPEGYRDMGVEQVLEDLFAQGSDEIF